MCRNCGGERLRRNTGALEERFRRRSQCRSERKRVARGRRKPDETRADELVQRLRNRQRLERVDVLVKDASQLQREERISARALVDAQQRLARERPADLVVKEPMQCADAQRADPQPFDVDRLLERGRLQPAGEDQPNIAAEASQREGECARRRGIEPLDVVDRNNDRLPLAQEVEHIAYGHGERAIVGGIDRAGVAQKRDLQRAPPRRGQLADHIVEDTVEEIAEPNVCQSALSLGRTRDEHDKPPFACRRDRREP